MTQYLVRNLRDAAHLELINPDLPCEIANMQSDLVSSFCPDGCKLSFFRISNNTDESRAREIALVVASKAPQLDDVDFMLIPESDVLNVGCQIDPVDGDTPVVEINKLHVDVCGLNLDRYIRLINVCVESSAIKRISKSENQAWLLESINTNFLDRKALRKSLLQELKI